ncbi:MAG: hypothetical protein WDW36_003103 [Sanguina aurantia]
MTATPPAAVRLHRNTPCPQRTLTVCAADAAATSDAPAEAPASIAPEAPSSSIPQAEAAASPDTDSGSSAEILSAYAAVAVAPKRKRRKSKAPRAVGDKVAAGTEPAAAAAAVKIPAAASKQPAAAKTAVTATNKLKPKGFVPAKPSDVTSVIRLARQLGQLQCAPLANSSAQVASAAMMLHLMRESLLMQSPPVAARPSKKQKTVDAAAADAAPAADAPAAAAVAEAPAAAPVAAAVAKSNHPQRLALVYPWVTAQEGLGEELNLRIVMVPTLAAAVSSRSDAGAAAAGSRIQVVGNTKAEIAAAASALVKGLATHESMELWSVNGGQKGAAACIWAVAQARTPLQTKHGYDAGFTAEFMGPALPPSLKAPRVREPKTAATAPLDGGAAPAESPEGEAGAAAAAAAVVVEPEAKPARHQHKYAQSNSIVAGNSGRQGKSITASYTKAPEVVKIDPLSVDRPFRVVVYRKAMHQPFLNTAKFLPQAAYVLSEEN